MAELVVKVKLDDERFNRLKRVAHWRARHLRAQIRRARRRRKVRR